MRDRRPHPPLRRALGLGTLALVALGGCTDPRGESAEDDAPSEPVGAQAPDPAREALAAQVAQLSELLATSRDHLRSAAAAEDVETARRAAAEAADLLVGEPDEDSPALLPGETPERGAATAREDLLTSTLTAAREAGEPGREVQEALRELVAGDLGAWQRDADGMVDQIATVADPAGTLEETEAAVLELGGEATRALAWALLTADAEDLEAATAYAERGAAHLGVARDAFAQLEIDE